jgi:hypothetical protein
MSALLRCDVRVKTMRLRPKWQLRTIHWLIEQLALRRVRKLLAR